jgi:hydroxyacylglutathione hydrolase
VHCQAGYRASVAASVLDAADRAVVAIDDDYDRAAGAGLPVAGAASLRAEQTETEAARYVRDKDH